MCVIVCVCARVRDFTQSDGIFYFFVNSKIADSCSRLRYQTLA